MSAMVVIAKRSPIERVVLGESHAHGNEENDSGDGEQDDADRQEHALGYFHGG